MEDRRLLAVDVPVGLFSNEPIVAVNPTNPNNVVVADYDQGLQTMKISNDGGTTFPITTNAALPAGQAFFQGDDSLAFDSQGRLFWSYLTGISPSPGAGGPNVVVQQVNSTTGALVGGPVFATGAIGNLDKEWIAADSNPASPFADNLYMVWTDFNQTNAPVRFARSIDSGATWTDLPGNLSSPGQGFTWPPEVAVAPNGDVWASWTTNNGGTNAEVRMRRSTDGGLTFGPDIIPFPSGTAATTTNSASGLANKITGLHVWLQGSMQPRILIDPVRANTVYVVSVDDPDNFSPTNDPSDIVLSKSTDNGLTWTRSTISQGTYGDSEIMPAAAIDIYGNIAVSWYDNQRHLTVPDSLGGTHDLLDLFTTTSNDGGLTFSTPTQINDTSFDPELGAPDRFGNHTMRIGEYNGLSIGGGFAHAVWTGNTATGQQTLYDKFVMPSAAPIITVDNPSVTVNEGSLATNSGTASDPDGTIASIVVSRGSVVLTGTTWTWNETPADDHPATGTPSDDYTVTIAVTDDKGETSSLDFDLRVNNVAPFIVAAGGGTLVDEGGSITAFGNFIDPALGVATETFTGTAVWSDGVVTPVTVDANTGIFNTTREFPDDHPDTGTPFDDFTVTFTITDDDTGSDTFATPALRVLNVDPTVNSVNLSADSIDEGDSVTVSGTFSDPALGVATETFTGTALWSDGVSTTVSVDGTNGTYSSTRTFPDDDPSTGTPSDNFTVLITITDDDTGSDSATSGVLTVNNVAPVIANLASDATLADKAEEGEAVNISATFTDVGILDTHTATVDWGDGTSGSAMVDSTGPGTGTINASHTYAAGGIYTITVTLTDDDTGSDTETTTAVVTGVGLNNGVLYIIGSSQDDHVSVNQTGQGVVKVKASFVEENSREFDLAAIDKVISYLCEGDDHLTISNNVELPAIVHGGGGADHLHAGGGPTVLLGDEGDDHLAGQSGRNILIGGLGLDRLIGGKEGDVLIGGTTDVDEDDDALMNLMMLWDSDDDYVDRAAAIDAALTVTDDNEADKLTGSSGQDLFYDENGDKLTDLKPDELVL